MKGDVWVGFYGYYISFKNFYIVVDVRYCWEKIYLFNLVVVLLLEVMVN